MKMKQKYANSILIGVSILAALMIGGAALAQTSTGYNLQWSVIGGGGEAVVSAHYAVNSTAGQGAASPAYSTGGDYVVSSGYWFSGGYSIYLPVVLKM